MRIVCASHSRFTESTVYREDASQQLHPTRENFSTTNRPSSQSNVSLSLSSKAQCENDFFFPPPLEKRLRQSSSCAIIIHRPSREPSTYATGFESPSTHKLHTPPSHARPISPNACRTSPGSIHRPVSSSNALATRAHNPSRSRSMICTIRAASSASANTGVVEV